MSTDSHVEIAVIGAGIAGIATAYYLCAQYGKNRVLLIDHGSPMSFTSAQSGDNYRNWWPHPTMVGFTNHSIDLMERIALESSNVIEMTRRGYVLATRKTDIEALIAELHAGYRDAQPDLIRVHNHSSPTSYRAPESADWRNAPGGVDVLSNRQLIRQTFPSFSDNIANVVHIRRAGNINGQQLGQYMLTHVIRCGGKRLRARLKGITLNGQFALDVAVPNGSERIYADIVLNAAGPFVNDIAAMLEVELPIRNAFQQKIAFEDLEGTIPRHQPFVIDLDDQTLDWADDEREMLAAEPNLSWLAGIMPGGVHCRPDGSDAGTRVKLGWAYNSKASVAQEEFVNDARFDPQFPEIVLRGAAALNPSLKRYADALPSRCSHYGGYYTMTAENWPLIGPLGVAGAFVVGALSGFGSMAACAAGALCAAWVAGGELPGHAKPLTRARYDNANLMAELENATSKGLL